MNSHKFAFIGGLHRSGTSILFRCLREHPQISGFSDTGVPEDEGMFLQSVYKPAKFYGGPGKFGFHAGAHLTEDCQLVTPENRSKILEEWAQYWDLSKAVLMEKSPPNLIRARFLQAMFPNSYFIMLIRHPIPVSYSTKKMSSARFYRLLHHWIVCHEILDSDLKYLKNVVILRYEDFVVRPEESLNSLYSFLGIDPHPVPMPVLSNVNDRYFARWNRRSGDPLLSVKRWYMEWRYEHRVREFGYSLRDIHWTPGGLKEPAAGSVRPRFGSLGDS